MFDSTIQIVESQSEVGDTVVIPEYGGMKLKLDGEELQVKDGSDWARVLSPS